jgi:ribosomal protein L37E
MRILDILTDGGPRDEGNSHYECRRCGTNLHAEADECPDCGGEVAVYTL